MGMLEQAQADIKRIRTDPKGFTRPMVFTKADDSMSVSIYGMHSKIHMTTTTIGEVVNGKKAHVSVSESALTDLGYVTRNAENECSLINDKVSVIDSTGLICDYVIREIYPDEAVGLIVCLLGDFE